MDPATLKAYLESVCAELDAGRTSLRTVRWAGAALVATGALTACFEKEDPVPLYGAIFDSGSVESVCDDEVDNDGDGLTDCADDDCVDDVACDTAADEEICNDDVDNDGDGRIDCADDDCLDDPACESTEEYGAPPA